MTKELSNLEIREQLYRIARSDMKLAREQGDVMITKTKKGNLRLEYDRTSKAYAIYTMGIDSECLCKNLTAKETPYCLADYYDVVIQPVDDELTPVNAKTGEAYTGSNVVKLLVAQADKGYPTCEWLTFKQALEIGRVVRKGEKSSAFITKFVPKKYTDKRTKEEKVRTVPKTYAVFNIAQTDELPQESVEKA